MVPLAVIKICNKEPALDLLYLDRNAHATLVCNDIGSCDDLTEGFNLLGI